jgi:hypothetical protein
MSDTNYDACVGRVSLNNLVEGDGKEISAERLEEFLESMIDLSSEHHGVRPDALVKVIYDGELIVLTQEQADHLLQDPTYEGESLNDLRAAVERALKGEAAFIRQELMVLVMMARMTLDQFRKDTTIDQVEIARLYPVLERTEKEADKILKEIEDMSNRIEKSRSQHPIISEYESKVGQMVALQQSADLIAAKRIAYELKSKKKHYLFCCRAMEPDIKSIQFRRLDLQKIKKRLLSIHRYLLAQKVDGLQFEVDSIKEKIKSFSSGQSIEKISISTASADKTNENLQELEKMIQVLQEREEQIKSIETQTGVFHKGEEKTETIISEIATNVLHVPKSADLNEQIADMEAQRKMRKEPERTEAFKPSRMVTLHRRRDGTP